MKRVILTAIFIAIFFTSNAFAQWSITYHEGDPLKETEACYANTYTCQEGNAFTCQTGTDIIRIYTHEGIFNTYNGSVNMIIGFYQGDKLIEKKEVWFYVPNDQPNCAYSNPYKQKKISRRIKEHLKSIGNVRILASRYGDPDLDIIIPMNTEIKL